MPETVTITDAQRDVLRFMVQHGWRRLTITNTSGLNEAFECVGNRLAASLAKTGLARIDRPDPTYYGELVLTEEGAAEGARRVVTARQYGSLPSCRYWALHDVDDVTHEPITPRFRRKRDAVTHADSRGWITVRGTRS